MSPAPRFLRAALTGLLALATGSALAKGEITAINTSTAPATPLTYTLGADTYQWGQGDNLNVDSIVYAGHTYAYQTLADQVVLRRVDNANASGKPCGLFVQTTGAPFSYAPDYPDDGTHNCDLGAVMGGRTINRGALDVFANTGTNAKNIERVDFIFSGGITAPLDPALLAQTGHVVTEKSGNNAVQIAAILSLDGSGVPSAFGPLVTVHPAGAPAADIQYGLVAATLMEFDFLANAATPPQGYPHRIGNSSESLGMAFVTLADLGIAAGQTYYGFAYFAPDVDPAAVTLTDPSTYPLDTDGGAGGPGDADLYGGTAGYFVLDTLHAISGTLFRDDNRNGSRDGGEAGVAGVDLRLYRDDGNGSLDAADTLLATRASGSGGAYAFTTLADGTYFVQVVASDPELPAGVTPPAARKVVLAGANASADLPLTPATAVLDDFDHDGQPDDEDIDDDNDGIPDSVEGTGDFDGDGIPNHHDLDADGDGISDLEESGLAEAVQHALDGDGDGAVDPGQAFGANGLADGIETAPESGQPDYDRNGSGPDAPADTDGDGHPDFLDLDTDNDGIHDVIEGGYDDADRNGRLDPADAGRLTNDPPDTDGDGIPDYRDLDTDDDGLLDIVEAGGVDADGNGRVDHFSDPDGDGYHDAFLASPLPLPDSDVNGVRDFRQCNCAQPLRTGLDGHGAGGLGGGWLALALAGLLRRRARRALGAALAGLLLAGTAHGADSPPERDFTQRLYLGAGLGLSRLEPESGCRCYRVGDRHDLAWTLTLGADLGKRFSVEGYYTDLGSAGIENRFGRAAGHVDYRHYGLSLIGYLWNDRHAGDYPGGFDDEGYFRRTGLSAYARLGWGRMRNSADLPYERVHDDHLHLGLGLEYGWDNGLAVRAEYTSYDTDAAQLSLGLVKRFGKVAAWRPPRPAAPAPAPVAAPPVAPPPPKPAEPAPLPALPVVYFPFDRATLTPAARAELDRFSAALQRRLPHRIEVRGHTDSVGSYAYNLRLSIRRAETVRRYLIEHGVPGDHLEAHGYGERQPVADNRTPEGRARNRRVDFRILAP